jgi:hypothetical protein
MKQLVSNQMDGGLNAQQNLAASLWLLIAAQDAIFRYVRGDDSATIVSMGGKRHD